MKGSPHAAAPRRRTVAALGAALVAIASMSAAVLPADAAPRPHPSSVVLDWERTAIRTIYNPIGGRNIPEGVLYLGFTSLAMHDAVGTSIRHPRSSEQAAAAVAAHDVLAEYFPAQKSALDGQLASSLGRLRSGPAKTTGIRIGAQAADDLIAGRVGDGRGASILYTKTPAPGVWQPPVGGAMLVPWLGFVDPLVVDEKVPVDGPDALTSEAYAADYDEVRRLGSETSTERSAYQTETARFFNSNSAIMVGEGLLDRLEDQPLGIQATARLFAVMHGAMADSLINCWELKYSYGFWRPFQAIAGAADDDNPLTTAEAGWKPLIGNPPYADYVSGHGCLTAPAVEAIRQTLGEQTPLVLHSHLTSTDRPYPTLSSIEHDAFHARIWGGLHFRDAMDDAYLIGHETARAVIRELR